MTSFIRAIQLRDLHRHEEAAGLFITHLTQYPEDAEGHAQLALTRLEMAGERRKALGSIDAAIGLEADNAAYQAFRSLILTQLDRDRDAAQAAEISISLDPELVVGWVAKAVAMGSMSRWEEAESAAVQALELDPDNANAQNQLAMILRAQGKLEAADRGIGKRLEHDPEDPMAHANVGWSALQRREVKVAEDHFREALRLDPEFEYARIGLRESFKARSGFYRLFMRWMFYLQRFSQGQRTLIFIGIFLAFKFGRFILSQVHPVAVAIFVTLYLILVFSSYLASGISHFLLLKDRNARLALNGREKLDGLFVGGGFLLGFALVLLALIVAAVPFGVAMIGGAFMVGAVPGAMFWTNDSPKGRLVFGSCLAFVYLTGLLCFTQDLRTGDAFAHPGGALVGIAVLATALCTWLSMIPSLHTRPNE